jgi:hypothetical protein
VVFESDTFRPLRVEDGKVEDCYEVALRRTHVMDEVVD